MSNLSDLLPAGAGGKQVDFVASGNLSNGQTVILKSNGQVEAVGSPTASAALGSQAFTGSIDSANTRVAFVGNNQFVLAFYNTNKFACVGTITGTSIVFNTPTQFDSGGNVVDSAQSTATGSATIFYQNAAGLRAGIVAIVSGTGSSATIGYGTEVALSSSFGGVCQSASIGGGRILITILVNSSPYVGTAIIVTVSGNSLTFGSSNFPFTSGYQAQNHSSCALADDKALICWRKNASDDNFIAVATVSGNSVTYGADNSFLQNYTAGNYMGLAALNATEGVVAYLDGSNNGYGTARSFTISGGTLTFGTKNVFSSNSQTYYNSISASGSVSGSSVYVIAYRQGVAGKMIPTTVSSNSITYGSELQYTASINALDTAIAVGGKVIIVYTDRTQSWPNSSRPSGSIYQGAVEVPNNTSFLGITDAAISSAASGSVTIKGGISSNVTGLTANSNYYVQTDGTLSTTSSTVLAGKALSSTSINLDYTT